MYIFEHLIDKKSKDILNNSFEKMKISTRAYSKILKVSRTIADLENSYSIKVEHILEAIQYRSLDKL